MTQSVRSVNAGWAAVFDMDGVIVDNKEFHFRAWRTFAAEHGLAFDDGAFRDRLFGRVNREILEGLFGHPLPPDEAAAMAVEKEALYRRLYGGHVRPAAGLREFLADLSAEGVPAAVSTAAPRINLEFVLDEAGLRSFFKVLVDVGMVTRGKPAPDLYLKAAEMLTVSPGNCVAFEDSLPGVASARAAGMKVVALTTAHSAAELSGISLAVPDFRTMSAARVRGLLDGTGIV